MIDNRTQLLFAQRILARFQAKLAELEELPTTPIRELVKQSVRSQIESLEAEIAAYTL